MKQLARISWCIVTLVTCGIQSLYAVQPVSDEYLAESAGENSIVLNEAVAYNKKFIVEQDIANRETPGYQTVNIINTLFPASFERSVGEQNDYFTQNFGSEYYSYRWYGNYQDIWDQNQYYDISFNHATGSYELNNVRGRVWIETETYRTNH